MSKPDHQYHLVDPSPLPIIVSFSLLVLFVGIILLMHDSGIIGKFIFPLGIVLTLSSSYSWWRDVVKEGREDKAHTDPVRKGLTIGMLLFILSEVMFFSGFFGAFFKAALDPVHNMIEGSPWIADLSVWPPKGITTLDPWNLPFLNTLILLLSGTTVTWAHHALINNDQKTLVKALVYTVALGASFTLIQAYEYHHATFAFKDGIYSSVFYMATGFHGAHVLIGTIFLIVCLVRAKKGHFAKGHGHLGFEFAAWYWHFVDAVWIFLFVFVYVWGS